MKHPELIDPALIETLERLLGLASRSFLRYVADISQPWISPATRHDHPGGRREWDQKAGTLLAVWGSASAGASTRLEDLLLAQKHHPVLPTWPMEFAQYNLVSPLHLLGLVIARMQPVLEEMEECLPPLAAWPEAREAAEALVAAERKGLREAEALEAERPHEPPQAGVKKGVSANFW